MKHRSYEFYAIVENPGADMFIHTTGVSQDDMRRRLHSISPALDQKLYLIRVQVLEKAENT